MQLSVRNPTQEDLPEISDIADKYKNNPLPNRFIKTSIVEIEDRVIAFGVLRNHFEALLYCDGTDKEKVEALKALVKKAIEDTKNTANIESLYVYAQDEQFAKILEKHFGFRRISAIPMILDL